MSVGGFRVMSVESFWVIIAKVEGHELVECIRLWVGFTPHGKLGSLCLPRYIQCFS